MGIEEVFYSYLGGMMNPKIVEKKAIILAGFSFYGNPFETRDPWSEENEIGKLWARLMKFFQAVYEKIEHEIIEPDKFYEVHITHPETQEKGEFEIFVGFQVKDLEHLPVEFLEKSIPTSRYAVFTYKGDEIQKDWEFSILRNWMKESGYQLAFPFNFQLYDHRFKGMDHLSESEIDIYIPIIRQSSDAIE